MISIAAVESQPQITPTECATAVVAPPPETHVFRSKLPDIAIPSHLPLHTYLFERLPECADRTCLIDGSTGETYTFARTHALSRRTAAALAGLGVGRGDVVMVLLQNCPEFALAYLGASMLGAVSTTANPFCTGREILKQFKASGARLVLTQAAYVDKLREEGEGELVVITTDQPPEGCLHFWALLDAADDSTCSSLSEETAAGFRPDDPVALPFSSGTTGLPKGVVLTHRSQVTGVAQHVDGENPNLYLKPDDVVLCVLPMFHIFSLVSVFLCSVRAGAALLLMKRFEIAALLRLIEKHRVTVAPVVPPLVLQLSKSAVVEEHDLSSIRIVLSGAAPLGKELEEALRIRVPQAIFGQGYGMTEAGPVISMCPGYAKHPLPTKSGSCGTVVRNAELKVVDPETGFSLRPNQPGEICIRGEQIMKGYLNDPEATTRTIDVEGWLHTGDIGYVDDDEEIFIVDRLKELIKFKGFQVPPAELESLLISHPAIADAAVVPQKDEAAGEVPVAFVVRAGGEEITEDAVKEFVSKQVVFYKRLHRVFFVPAIPKSAAGKILRKELRAKLAAQSSQ